MNNFSKEVLRITIDKLKNKVESIMLKISILLDDEKNVGAVDILESYLFDLDKNNGALIQAKNLLSQLEDAEDIEGQLKKKVEMLKSLSRTKDNDIKFTE